MRDPEMKRQAADQQGLVIAIILGTGSLIFLLAALSATLRG